MDTSREREIRDNEELINWLNHNISDYMVTVASHELPAEDSEYIGRLFHVITDLERIGDHALNILERTEIAQQGEMKFSENAMRDFQTVYEKALELLDRSIGAFANMHLLQRRSTRFTPLRIVLTALPYGLRMPTLSACAKRNVPPHQAFCTQSCCRIWKEWATILITSPGRQERIKTLSARFRGIIIKFRGIFYGSVC
jgi:hypothetical protein